MGGLDEVVDEDFEDMGERLLIGMIGGWKPCGAARVVIVDVGEDQGVHAVVVILHGEVLQVVFGQGANGELHQVLADIAGGFGSHAKIGRALSPTHLEAFGDYQVWGFIRVFGGEDVAEVPFGGFFYYSPPVAILDVQFLKHERALFVWGPCQQLEEAWESASQFIQGVGMGQGFGRFVDGRAVSYTHLTLPTIA